MQVNIAYLQFLVSPEVAGLTAEGGTEKRHIHALLRNFELEELKDKLPKGWKYFLVEDRATFIAVRVDLESSTLDEYTVRYEYINMEIVKLDYRTGLRTPVTGEELVQFYAVVDLYEEAVLRGIYKYEEEA